MQYIMNDNQKQSKLNKLIEELSTTPLSDEEIGAFVCARHGTILTGESPVTGIYRQV